MRVASSYLPDNCSALDKRRVALDIWAIVHGYVSINHHATLSKDPVIDWKSMAIRAVSVQLDALDIDFVENK